MPAGHYRCCLSTYPAVRASFAVVYTRLPLVLRYLLPLLPLTVQWVHWVRTLPGSYARSPTTCIPPVHYTATFAALHTIHHAPPAYPHSSAGRDSTTYTYHTLHTHTCRTLTCVPGFYLPFPCPATTCLPNALTIHRLLGSTFRGTLGETSHGTGCGRQFSNLLPYRNMTRKIVQLSLSCHRAAPGGHLPSMLSPTNRTALRCLHLAPPPACACPFPYFRLLSPSALSAPLSNWRNLMVTLTPATRYAACLLPSVARASSRTNRHWP